MYCNVLCLDEGLILSNNFFHDALWRNSKTGGREGPGDFKVKQILIVCPGNVASSVGIKKGYTLTLFLCKILEFFQTNPLQTAGIKMKVNEKLANVKRAKELQFKRISLFQIVRLSYFYSFFQLHLLRSFFLFAEKAFKNGFFLLLKIKIEKTLNLRRKYRYGDRSPGQPQRKYGGYHI